MDQNFNLIKALVATLHLEVESLEDASSELDGEPIDLYNRVRDFEAKIIRTALIKTGGNQKLAAKLLTIKTSTLNSKIKQFGIHFIKYKQAADEVSLAKAA